MSQLVVIAEAEIDPGQIERIRIIGEKMILASRREPGCVSYAYSFDMLQPNLMRVIEIWASDQALREHFAMPHMAEFRHGLAETRAKILSIKVHELGKESRLPA